MICRPYATCLHMRVDIFEMKSCKHVPRAWWREKWTPFSLCWWGWQWQKIALFDKCHMCHNVSHLELLQTTISALLNQEVFSSIVNSVFKVWKKEFSWVDSICTKKHKMHKMHKHPWFWKFYLHKEVSTTQHSKILFAQRENCFFRPKILFAQRDTW